jgi:hypothetical protein
MPIPKKVPTLFHNIQSDYILFRMTDKCYKSNIRDWVFHPVEVSIVKIDVISVSERAYLGVSSIEAEISVIRLGLIGSKTHLDTSKQDLWN